MTDGEWLFEQSRKSSSVLARNSKYRKRGSKSRKCTLPSEHMTKKEIDKMNGEVRAYKLNKPMKWDEFKLLPKDIKREYIVKLVDEYGARAKDIAEMLGVSNGYISKYLKNEFPDLKLFDVTGARSPQPAWLIFIGSEENRAEEVKDMPDNIKTQGTPSESVKPADTVGVSDELVYTVNSCKLNYTGRPAVIFQKALLALDPSVEYCITIEAYPEEDESW